MAQTHTARAKKCWKNMSEKERFNLVSEVVSTTRSLLYLVTLGNAKRLASQKFKNLDLLLQQQLVQVLRKRKFFV